VVKGKPKGYWVSIDNQRNFLIGFAKKNGFDPLDSNSWKNVTIHHLLAEKVKKQPSAPRLN